MQDSISEPWDAALLFSQRRQAGDLRALPRDRLLLRGRRGLQGLELLRLLAELAVPLLGGGEVLAAAEAVDAEVASVYLSLIHI